MDRILLFIPCYNCENEVVKVLESLKEYAWFSEIIVVDNGSRDNTIQKSLEFAKNDCKLNVKVLKNQDNYNLGGSHKVAFNYAIENNFDYVVVLHGDNQGDISDIKEIIENKIYKNYDCCLGARFKKGAKLVNYSRIRILGNIAFNILFSIALMRKIYDLGGGLNIYSVNMLNDRFFIKFPDALTFNYAMTLALDFYKPKYMFFPLTWKEDGQVSNVSIVKQTIELFLMLVRYILNKKKFITSEMRTKIVEDYRSNCLNN